MWRFIVIFLNQEGVWKPKKSFGTVAVEDGRGTGIKYAVWWDQKIIDILWGAADK